jgi:hypothetical protein
MSLAALSQYVKSVRPTGALLLEDVEFWVPGDARGFHERLEMGTALN